MAIEPSSIQRDKMLAHGKTKLTLVQFLAFKDAGAIKEYFLTTGQAVQKEGGTREHQLRIDGILTFGEMPYQYLAVDRFPSSESLLLAHEYSRDVRNQYLTEVYSLIVQPNPAVKKIARGFGFMAPFLTNILGTAEAKGIEQFQEHANELDPETDPDASKVIEFGSENPDEPFYMMNLNQFSYSPRRGEGGKSAYFQYAARIMPRLISVGGSPDVYGKILGSYVGDSRSGLHNSWHDFALVYYPSRTSFLRLMSNTPRGAAEIRREGLKKVILMACS